jgi:ElaB/YqjD/DUF883 family membrane-anchored ribosome-binding protein
MENVTRTIENALDKGQQDLQGQYQNAKERASAAVRSASDKGTQVWSDTTDYVRRNPAQAVGISLAAGAALGVLAYALISRRDSNPAARLRKIAETSQDGWSTVKDAVEKGLGGLKQALHDVQSSLS